MDRCPGRSYGFGRAHRRVVAQSRVRSRNGRARPADRQTKIFPRSATCADREFVSTTATNGTRWIEKTRSHNFAFGNRQMTWHDETIWFCPTHRSALTSAGDALRCDEGCCYPLRNGIPRFVSSENYSAAFGSQWKKYRLTQLDSHTSVPISRNRLMRCLGDALSANLRNKQVLEAGCGAGRFTEILLEKGAYVT